MKDDYVSRQYLRKDLQSAKDDPCVIDAMTDLAIRTVMEAPAVDILEFSQEEKQIIWDALYHYLEELYDYSHSDHFARDIFEKKHRTCENLMKRLDEKWSIMH